MIAQRDLFDIGPARARRADPRSSHVAARTVEGSGRASVQRARCLAAVKAWPRLTSQELSEMARLDRYELARRLPEMRAAGLLCNPSERNCRITGRLAMTWEAL